MTETETKLQAEVAAKDKKIAELQTQLASKGNGNAASAGEFAKLERELSDLLMQGPQPLEKLPANLRDNRFLLYMVKSNQVEFGRAPHYFNAKDQLMPGDGEMAWTNCSGQGMKSLPELLAEEKRLAEANKLERVASIPTDFGGEIDKGTEPKKVPVNIRLQVRLSARAA